MRGDCKSLQGGRTFLDGGLQIRRNASRVSNLSRCLTGFAQYVGDWFQERKPARRPGGFAIRRKKKVRPMKTGGFVIPHNSPSITKRLPHNNHFQQSPTPCIIYRRTIKIILRIPHELGSHRILMNIIQLLLEKLER